MHGNFGHAGNNRDIGPQPYGSTFDVAGPVRSNFEHQPLRIILFENDDNSGGNIHEPLERIVPTVVATENGERHADLAIEALGTLAHMLDTGERTEDRVFRGGLAYAPRDSDDARLVAHERKARFPRDDQYDALFKEIHDVQRSGGMS